MRFARNLVPFARVVFFPRTATECANCRPKGRSRLRCTWCYPNWPATRTVPVSHLSQVCLQFCGQKEGKKRRTNGQMDARTGAFTWPCWLVGIKRQPSFVVTAGGSGGGRWLPKMQQCKAYGKILNIPPDWQPIEHGGCKLYDGRPSPIKARCFWQALRDAQCILQW